VLLADGREFGQGRYRALIRSPPRVRISHGMVLGPGIFRHD
jgi:hypothetical protein